MFVGSQIQQLTIMKRFEKYSVVILYIATIAGLGFSFFGSVLNSRLLSKELFGDFKYIQNFIMLLSFLVNFGFYYSGARLIASTEDKNKIAVLKGYLIFISIGGLLLMLLTTVVIGLGWHKLLSADLFKLTITIFPLLIVHPLMFYFESIFQAERKMISFSFYKILPPVLYFLLLFKFKSYCSQSLFINSIFYYGSFFIVFLFFIVKDRQVFKKKSVELNELLVENKTYGIHLFYGSILNVGASYLLPLLIGFFNINNIDVGNFSLALSFIIPFTFLPAIVGTSYFKEFITLNKIPVAALKRVVLSSLLLLIVTMAGIDFFIKIFLGDKYHEVGFLVRIGAPAAILHGLGDFTNKFLSAKGEANYIKKVAIIMGIVQLMASLIFIKLFSATGAMVAKSIGSTVYFCCLYFYYHKKYAAAKKSVLMGTL